MLMELVNGLFVEGSSDYIYKFLCRSDSNAMKILRDPFITYILGFILGSLITGIML